MQTTKETRPRGLYFNVFLTLKRNFQYVQKAFSIFFLIVGLLLAPIYAQEPTPDIDVEESAEVFLEDYSDEFQENFFEALKQKGIENYDRAINLLLECKRLDAENRVVDHELAKVYLEEKQYPLAEEYALTALTSEPENLWYADTFVQVLRKQGKSIDNVRTGLPYEYPKFNENLALIYFKKKEYQTALSILKGAKKSKFTSALSSKINDSIEKQQALLTSNTFAVESIDDDKPNAFNQYKTRIQGFMQTNDLLLLQQVSEEALENYPSQPFLYYAQGYALNKSSKHKEAIEMLEIGLDYMVGDVSLGNKIYQELSDAYNSLNNSVKANMYLRKIKPGF